ncbi:MAG: hypothetical protein KC708_22445 [Anaerolineae bacterium]|nr:hypothetical protein [Anaerolineae bacterium]
MMPVPLAENAKLPSSLSFDAPLSIPEATHLQPFLYPENPYWGDHLRAVNDQAWIYRRTFVTPDEDYLRARLRFEAVDYFAEVWLNDQLIGRHEGHFAPFEFDITSVLNSPGQGNELVVRVTSPWDAPNPHGTYPTDHVFRGLVKGLYEHGEGLIPPNVNPIGIWRPTYLLLDQGISIDHVRIRTDLDGTLHLDYEITNATAHTWYGQLVADVRAENHEGDGASKNADVALTPGQNTFALTLHVADAQLWWPYELGAPNLYALTSHLVDGAGETATTSTETFGFRTVELLRSPQKFEYRVNGQPIFIRGSSYIPAVYLSEVDEATFRRDLQLALDAHLNLLRVHVHISPKELYDLCDRHGMLVWQDFELNWIHDTSEEFEQRAVSLQRDMFRHLINHPSIITWSSYNEPTMVFTRRHNLEQRPVPALYEDALKLDSTRPVFMCSGQMDEDWQRSGDSHSYFGSLWSRKYTDLYSHFTYLSSEFGIETPPALETLQAYPELWQRQQHLADAIEDIWTYEADLTQYHIEHFRRLRASGCAGYVHFYLVDVVPQVGCGSLDAHRLPKGGYRALRHASQPLHIALEHDGRKPRALWIFNDTFATYDRCTLIWRVYATDGALLLEQSIHWNVAANASQEVLPVKWPIHASQCAGLELLLLDADGNTLAENHYDRPFEGHTRPKGYPWKFDFVLGTKVYDKPDAPSLASESKNKILRFVPLRVQERLAEWVLRLHLSPRVASLAARLFDRLV